MTLLTPDSLVTATGNGSTTAFSYPRKFISNSHVVVTLDGTVTTAYTLTGAGSESGGTVTFSSAPGSGVRIAIYRAVPFTQETDLENFDGNPAVVHENQLDLIVMQTQNLDERADRSISAPIDDVLVNMTLPKSTIRANGYMYFGPSGEILVTTDSVGTSTAAAAASASAADASADAAALSAAAASAAASSAMWSDVVFLTSASSPYTVTSANSGDLLSVDTSGGAVVITLPQISTLTLPFNIGIKKTTSDTNSVTINRSSTDTIGSAATSKSLTTQNQGCTLVADTDPVPDQWAVGDFGDISAISQALVLIKTVTVSSPVTSVDFVHGTGGVVFDSTYKAYLLIYTGVTHSGAGDNLWLRTSTNAGVSYDSGASDYGRVGSAYNYAGASRSDFGSAGSAQVIIGGIDDPQKGSGSVLFLNPSDTASNKTIIFNTTDGSSGLDGHATRNSVTTDIDAFRILAATANIAAGTFKLYGYN